MELFVGNLIMADGEVMNNVDQEMVTMSQGMLVRFLLYHVHNRLRY